MTLWYVIKEHTRAKPHNAIGEHVFLVRGETTFQALGKLKTAIANRNTTDTLIGDLHVCLTFRGNIDIVTESPPKRMSDGVFWIGGSTEFLKETPPETPMRPVWSFE